MVPDGCGPGIANWKLQAGQWGDAAKLRRTVEARKTHGMAGVWHESRTTGSPSPPGGGGGGRRG
jgi:hypothetical protein